jgi:predicted nucleotidyltransferase
MRSDVERARAAVPPLVERYPALSLIVLFGSRARGDARADSDWDIAFAAAGGLDVLALRADLVEALGSDRVDVVDLERASALLRYRVARDGVPLFERPPASFERFWMQAVRFWCDVEPLVREGHEAILEGLGR